MCAVICYGAKSFVDANLILGGPMNVNSKTRVTVIAIASVAFSIALANFALAGSNTSAAPEAAAANILSAPATTTPADVAPMVNDELMPIEAPEAQAEVDDIQKSLTVDQDANVTTQDPELSKKAQALLQKGDALIQKNQKLVKAAIEKERKILTSLSKLLDQITIAINLKTTQYIHNDGLGLTIGYTPATAPAYFGKYHYRQDSYLLQLPASIGNWIKSRWVMFNVRPSVLIEFFQFFDSRKEAENFKHMYLPKHFPSTAAKALDPKLMKNGDIAHLQGGVWAAMGGTEGWQMNQLAVSPQVGYVLNGQYDMFMLKVVEPQPNGTDLTRFHMRLIGQRQHGVFGELTFGVSSLFAPFAWHVLTNGLIHLLNLDQILWGYAFRGDEDVYMADYVLNLNDPDVASAYDGIMDEMLRFKKNENGDRFIDTIFNPLKSSSEVGAELKLDTQSLDDIYKKDVNEPDITKRRVDRNFLGSNIAVDQPNLQGKFGIGGVWRDEKVVVHRENQLTMLTMQPDGTEKLNYFSFPMYTSTDSLRAAVTYFQHNKARSANIIYITDKNFVPTDFDSIGFYYDFTTKRYTDAVHQDTIRHFQKMLPDSAFKAFTAFLATNKFEHIENGLIPNLRLSARYFITTDGLVAATQDFKNLSHDERVIKMRKLLIDHLRTTPKTDTEHHRLFASCGGDYAHDDKIESLCKDVEEIAEHLVVAIDDSSLPQVREKQMDILAHNKLFLEVGPGFLMATIPPEKLDSTSFFEIKFYLPGVGTAPLLFQYPAKEVAHREFYETIKDIQNIMSNMTPDMRLPTDHDDLTHRKTTDPLGGGDRFDK
jgi:hypothetical protein